MDGIVVISPPPERQVACPRLDGIAWQKMKENDSEMREFWVTVGAMVLGYLMYLGLRSMFKK